MCISTLSAHSWLENVAVFSAQYRNSCCGPTVTNVKASPVRYLHSDTGSSNGAELVPTRQTVLSRMRHIRGKSDLKQKLNFKLELDSPAERGLLTPQLPVISGAVCLQRKDQLCHLNNPPPSAAPAPVAEAGTCLVKQHSASESFTSAIPTAWRACRGDADLTGGVICSPERYKPRSSDGIHLAACRSLGSCSPSTAHSKPELPCVSLTSGPRKRKV
ncbi:hypothetical protein AV530_019541 [Patagioenas fasciata monilis]|uniref:Uncharacterized protein n=1 Tax=Patagioenas fasciata monilis TaxID=372326 RepID=A0A1V4JDV1_PATFA|nr:hypothetical protein AV530_019541 [Patagioenas fasciata monilis]